MMRKVYYLCLVVIAAATACSPTDKDIQAHVTEVLKASPGVTAQVRQGVVILSGTVQDSIIASAAAEAASKVNGVQSVSSKVQVVTSPIQVHQAILSH